MIVMSKKTKQPKRVEVSGLLEITEKGHGFLRDIEHHFTIRDYDTFVSRELIRKWRLQDGLVLSGQTDGLRGRNPNLGVIEEINGEPPDAYMDRDRFDQMVIIDPKPQIRLETGTEPLGTRAIDILTPIGKGQRGLIVAAPRTGKTILLQQIAHGIATNHPEIHLMVLLVDERPEEVTDMKRTVKGEVIASSNDKMVDNHVRVARLAMERAKRLLEYRRHVVVLLDSITRLGRAFNSWVRSSGRTMTGGLDVRALQLPKQIFGSARNIEHGGSLTIIATALVDTGSRMDEVIFQEFKGTGNMELVLDQKLANRRIWPAMDLSQSGTRKEELLIDRRKLQKIARLRRHLDSLAVGQDMESFLIALKKHKSNDSFMSALP
jgi:transcription termination factor Rho